MKNKMKKLQQLWDEQADELNQFESLSSDEVAEFANNVIESLFGVFDAHCNKIHCENCPAKKECCKLDDARSCWEVIYNIYMEGKG